MGRDSAVYSIFIVEDDKKISSLIKSHFEKYGYLAYTASDYLNIRNEFIQVNPSVVLLDINLPRFDGFYWCREIRTISKVPVIFISARFTDMDQVMAIENGGDDYIVKPFSLDVLTAKIKGVIRRVYGEYSENENADVQGFGSLVLSKGQHTAEYKGKKVELSKREFSLLHCLVKKSGDIVSREELLEALWDDMSFVDDNTLSVNVTRVRKRLEELGIYDAVETKRGQGYCLKDTWDDNPAEE
jgi:Response regulators consisting of a CheY-like receiver domain and a winged-helix DNA-binding domain